MDMLTPTTHQRRAPLSPCAQKQSKLSVRELFRDFQGLARRNGCTSMHANVAPHRQLLQVFAKFCKHKMITEMAVVLRLPGHDHATIVCGIHNLIQFVCIVCCWSWARLCPTGSWPLWKPKWITCWPVASQARDEFQRLRCIPIRFNVNIYIYIYKYFHVFTKYVQ